MNYSVQESRTTRNYRLFQTIRMAMNHPGSVYPVMDLEKEPDAVTCLLGCLIDREKAFSVIGDEDLESRLIRNTGGRPGDVDTADFIVAAHGATEGLMPRFKRGTLESPEQGAFLVYRVNALGYGNYPFTISGPGVDGTTELEIAGFDLAELHQIRAVNAQYPLGIDVLFVDWAGRISALHRSTRIGLDG